MKKLRTYQKDALGYLISGGGCLFLEMRLGKTLIAIRYLNYLGLKKILIVAPYSALNSWEEELTSEKQSYITVFGNKGKRLACLQTKVKYYLINKEGHLVVPKIGQIKWDAVILDESTFIKSPAKVSKKTGKSSAGKFYIENFMKVPYKIILTGTPAPEHDLEYFNQLYFINPDILGFKNYWIFRNTCFKEFGFKYSMLPTYRKKFNRLLNKHCFFLSRKDAGIENKKIYELRTLEMPAMMKKQYKELKNEFRIGKMKTIYAVTKFLWMRRLFGGFINDGFLYNGKLNIIKELLNSELKNQSVVIYCNFIKELFMLHKYIKNSEIIYGDVKFKTRVKIINKFQAGNFNVLLCQPECVKHGQDFSVADTIIYYSSAIGLETRKQSEDRIINVKNNNPKLIIDIAYKNSIDIKIAKMLKQKNQRVDIQNYLIKELSNAT